MFPNPASELLNIQIPSANDITTLKIYDILGKAIFEHTLNTPSNLIDVSHMAPGVYLLSFQSGKSSKTVKFIKS